MLIQLSRKSIMLHFGLFVMLVWLVNGSVWAACGLPPNRPSSGNWCFLDGVHVRVWWDDQVFPERRELAAGFRPGLYSAGEVGIIREFRNNLDGPQAYIDIGNDGMVIFIADLALGEH